MRGCLPPVTVDYSISIISDISVLYRDFNCFGAFCIPFLYCILATCIAYCVSCHCLRAFYGFTILCILLSFSAFCT